MDNTNTALAEEVSPTSTQGEITNPDEARLAYATELLSDSPSMPEVAEADSAPEVSEEEQVVEDNADEESAEVDEEQSSDDKTPVEDEADESEETESLGDEELPVVDYDEAKKFRFEIDGSYYTIDQIKSMKGQAADTSKAQSEVRSREEAVARKEVEQEQLQQFLNATTEVQNARMQMQQLSAAYAGIEQQIASIHPQDPNRGNIISDLQQQQKTVSQQYSQAQQFVESTEKAVQKEKIQNQIKILNDKGYGALVTDKQRFETVSDYGKDNLDAEAYEFFKNNASAMIILEKARMSDSAKTKAATGKRTGSKTTLKGRSQSQSGPSVKAQQDLVKRMKTGHVTEDESAAMRQAYIRENLMS